MSSKRVALVMKGYIGDTVMATPLLSAVRSSGWDPNVMAPMVVGDVLGDGWTDRFSPLRSKRGFGSLREQTASLRRLRPDAVLLVNRSFRSALAARLARIPIRSGHDTESRGGLLTHRFVYSSTKFEAQCYVELAEPIGIPGTTAGPSLEVTMAEAQAAEERIPAGAIGFQPGARYVEKQVPIKVLASVANEVAKDHPIVILGGPDEIEAGRQFESALEAPAINLVGLCTIRETIGALSRLRAMVGSDTGVMHLAAGVGCPSVTVFGPNPASKWGHAYGPHQVLMAPGGRPADLESDEILAAMRRALGFAGAALTTPRQEAMRAF